MFGDFLVGLSPPLHLFVKKTTFESSNARCAGRHLHTPAQLDGRVRKNSVFGVSRRFHGNERYIYLYTFISR